MNRNGQLFKSYGRDVTQLCFRVRVARRKRFYIDRRSSGESNPHVIREDIIDSVKSLNEEKSEDRGATHEHIYM